MTTEVLDLKASLKEFFGFDSFKGMQEQVISTILKGNDCFVIMPTGAGKSLCYQLPALISNGTAVIISPLIALMKNQVDAIRGFGENDSIAHFLNSSLTKTQTERVKRDVSEGRTKMLYVAPETLKKDETIDFLRSVKLSFVAVDEAHCISEWGHDFRPEYRRIKQIVKEIDDVPMVALTATATPKVQLDIQKTLNMLDAQVFKSSFNRANLYYEVLPKGSKAQTMKDLISFINKRKGKSGIVYCLSRKKTEEVAEILQANGINALPYHAGLDAKTRAGNQDKFLMEDADVICATIAFGMGIDKPDVRFVIHYDVPKSLEGYYQETGRAGRDGMEGDCVLFYNPKDTEKLEKFLKDKPVAEREIGTQLISEMAFFAESSQCRRKSLLHYFGENFDTEKCDKMCDNCRNPRETEEATNSLVAALKTIQFTDGKVGLKHIINILMGKASPEVKAYKHNHHELFGFGKEKNENYWKTLIRYGQINNLIIKNIELYGLLSISKDGLNYLTKPTSVQIALDKEYDAISDADFESIQIEAVYDKVLYAKLKELQKEVAKDMGLPPYVIFQETSLEDMAFKFPITMDEMENITGVGKNKAKKFGKPFIQLISNYVDENNIERPDDLVLKSVVNKSARKIHIIQNIDKKVSIEDIAKGQGLDYEELIEELEAIVFSGTQVDLLYYIDEIIDEEGRDEIYDYFKSDDSGSIDAAVNEFDGEFTHEEMKIFQIQFMSDVAN
ncbi:MAG: DNA helicase RecQ [Bacteroidia bacterium]|jgi:ATP-dependent DNA helicase RecQ|nr:DNA helicase RecQ [Bacteroidia bacterium]MDG2041316.1 DNA helicase RecQ [Bacteroidia bacterium]|tara:strand:+ start:7893 stop:10085 length:2193 start_codon:yes stop_codon:yes gene_type:complete